MLTTEAQVNALMGARQAREEAIRHHQAMCINIDTDDDDDEPNTSEGGRRFNAPTDQADVPLQI